jgi:O-antigen/teichoic acid export membrane protein
MTTARIYARNLLSNWGAQVINLVVMFLMSPFVINKLGPVEYGIWSLLIVVTGYMGMLDLGVRASTGRYVILYLGKGDDARLNETVRTGIGAYTIAGCLILVVGAVLGWFFPSLFTSVPAEYYGTLRVLLPVMAANVWITAIRVIYSSVLTAHDRFDIARAVDLAVLAAQTAGTVVVLKLGYGIRGLAPVVIGCNVVGLVGNRYLAHRTHPGLRAWPPSLIRGRLRELFSYGSAAFICGIGQKMVNQVDILIVGAMIGVAAVTTYSVGGLLIYYSAALVGQIGATFFPPVQRAAVRGQIDLVRTLLYRQVRIALMLGLLTNMGFIAFGGKFIELWMVGPKFDLAAAGKATVVMTILAGSRILYLLTIGSDGLLAALGYIKFNAATAVAEALTNLGLSVLFVAVFGWGLAGVAAGSLAARLVSRAFIVPWYACRKIGLSFGRFLLETAGPACLAAAAFAGVCYVIRIGFPTVSWRQFVVQVALALACYALIAWILLVPQVDRRRVMGWLRSRWRPAGEV